MFGVRYNGTIGYPAGKQYLLVVSFSRNLNKLQEFDFTFEAATSPHILQVFLFAMPKILSMEGSHKMIVQ